MTTSLLALRGLLVLLAGLPLASLAGEPLIVVEDRGGTSALPYYEALNLQPRANAPARPPIPTPQVPATRSEEHTSELQSLMRNSYAVFCLKNKKTPHHTT